MQYCSVNIQVHCCSVLFFPGWAWAGGVPGSIGIHFSSHLTLSVEFLRFHVGPVRRTTVYASTPQSQSIILLLVVLQSVL